MTVVGQTADMITVVDKTSIKDEADGATSAIVAFIQVDPPTTEDGKSKIGMLSGRMHIQCHSHQARTLGHIYGITLDNQILDFGPASDTTYVPIPEGTMIANVGQFVCSTSHPAGAQL